MIFPAFKKKFGGLSSRLIDSANLFSTLKDDAFTGILYVFFPEIEAAVFFEEGEIIGILEEREGERKQIFEEDLLAKWDPRGTVEAYITLPEEVFTLYSLLSLPLIRSEEMPSLELAKLIVEYKKEKRRATVEIEAGGRRYAIYIREGRVVWNTSSPEIFQKNLPVKARIYTTRSEKELWEELPSYEKVIGQLSSLFRKAKKRSFAEDFLFFIHEELGEQCEVLDPFLGNFNLEGGKIIVGDEVKASELLPCLKRALKLFMKKRVLEDPKIKDEGVKIFKEILNLKEV